MTTTIFLMLVCVILLVIALYLNRSRKSNAQELKVAEDNYVRIDSQKAELESQKMSHCKEIARLEALCRTTANDLIKAHLTINTMGVKRASDGTFRSSDADAIPPRKPRVVKRNQPVATEV
jgi:septal ring factor EnvC (AmiA/AmiB activator)